MLYIIYILAGLGAGIVTGLAGLSAAVIITPMLVSLCGWASYDAVTVALTGAVSHISMGAQIFPIPMLAVVLSCLIGALVSARFANRCEITRLNKIVGVVLTLLGITTILIKLL